MFDKKKRIIENFLVLQDITNLEETMTELRGEKGVGSKFSFESAFNLSKKHDINRSLDLCEYSKNNLGVHILVVDDSKINQIVVERVLTNKKWSVDTADHGREALEKLEKNHYDVVLMDIQMPIMDGYETSKRIRENESKGHKRIPIIALTANVTEADKIKAIEAGMDDYLTKPIKPEDIYTSILKHINKIS